MAYLRVNVERYATAPVALVELGVRADQPGLITAIDLRGHEVGEDEPVEVCAERVLTYPTRGVVRRIDEVLRGSAPAPHGDAN